MNARFAWIGLTAALVTLLLPGTASAETAARVLLALGDVVALRGGQAIALVTGSTVEVGDQIRTGPSSNTQIRFTDGAVVSIKPRTVFSVNEYVFNGREDGSERVVFNLIQGGFRTVTGLIGHLNKKNYELRTPTATVGIRGTVWGAQHCVASECVNGDGSIARPGTYGEVKSGALAVSNDMPETEFGPNSSFYVADRNTPAQRLLVTPDFVVDQLQSRTRNAGKSGDQTGEVNIANAGDGRATPILTSNTGTLAYATADSRTPSGGSASIASLSNVTGFVNIYTVGVNAFDGISSCNPGTSGGCSTSEVQQWTFSGNQLVSYGGASGSPAALTQTATVANVKSLDIGNGETLVGAQLVGPYSGVTSGGSAFSGPGGFLYGFTNSSLVNGNFALPSSGSFTFGNPGPFIGLAVDSAGNTATTTQFSGSFNAGTRNVSFSGNINFGNVVGFGAANFSLGGSGVIPGGSDGLSNTSLTWTCAGAGCAGGAGGGAFDARFIHSATNIPAMVLNGGMGSATKNATTGNTVVFLGGLRCVSGGC
jgi:hypothetical protein